MKITHSSYNTGIYFNSTVQSAHNRVILVNECSDTVCKFSAFMKSNQNTRKVGRKLSTSTIISCAIENNNNVKRYSLSYSASFHNKMQNEPQKISG